MTCAVPHEFVAEAGQRQFLGDDITAGDAPPLQHQAAVTGLREIRGGNQAVVPGARDHDIELVGHMQSRTIVAGPTGPGHGRLAPSQMRLLSIPAAL